MQKKAIVREIKEELTCDIEVDYLLHTIEYDYPNFHLCMKCFISRIVSGELNFLEHEAFRWLNKDELYTVDWLPADIELIPMIEKIL